MALTQIFILIAVALLIRLASGFGIARGRLLMVASIVAIFWLQPAVPIRFLGFWLPVATIFITVFTWLLTAEKEQKLARETQVTAAWLIAVIALIAASRLIDIDSLWLANRPPQLQQVLVGLAILLLAAIGLAMVVKPVNGWLVAGIVLLITLFIMLKTAPLAGWASMVLRSLVQQSTSTASPVDIRWLGFSYIAFRLIHTLRDRQNGRLAQFSLQDTINYVIFFPSFSAGPIDRLPHFVKELQQPVGIVSPQLSSAFLRLTVGIFKKFALAGGLSLVALNSLNASQLNSSGWVWLLVYAYALLIYFDFAGYTDIAIGLGLLAGIQLPENFNQPYLKPNLTQFWNNWHITLTQWFRAYFFNPFTRALRSRYRNLSVGWIVFITQLSTMILIGLWHGVSWNFVMWGLWHGLGLFVHNRFADWVKPRQVGWNIHPRLQPWLNGFNTFFTFNFVALGWVWFALPNVTLSLQVFAHLFGMGGG